jgi:hypothetical protein
MSHWYAVPRHGNTPLALVMMMTCLGRMPITIRMMMMSETSPKAPSEFEKAAAESQSEPGQRVLVVPGTEQEMVAVADCDRHATAGHPDPAVQHRGCAVHLHAVLISLALIGNGRGGLGDRLGIAQIAVPKRLELPV